MKLPLLFGALTASLSSVVASAVNNCAGLTTSNTIPPSDRTETLPSPPSPGSQRLNTTIVHQTFVNNTRLAHASLPGY
ncbi:hypothetical protein J3F83DRAFT_756726 [Trichoderma novae-zelandiae]